ncbi:hypothetical protein EV361DRAFT_886721 [Lentinula raphanica]|uniref:HTH APSES-type domain-containing protein n=1 Tax=Lentinula raphanica TaxID=153919 RepID=A0AA38UFW4_9AGAR|nr:hypothetical protein C8R42DRAFT_689274 [Lentinula raphanica]KAJ3820353.1 hypothetical protein F5880DRAFT_1588913 [Lentinula raphanica]KAJ3840014.1 hypothetical protein F5878DRAFT_90070 [Lentinula raphanica]KAJ3975828.1 hypothetical protein EV361DRAFT_886721 [Lentinula raphanica]
MLQENTSNVPSPMGPKFRPYASSNHHVTKGRYITSNDPRGYIPVYEYPLNGQWIMMDIDDGYILWTGIWKALGNSKADIVKMIDSQPDLAPLIRRVRGGYLKIQGTWMPYEVALRLARRVAWPIRDDLIPLFGPTFPSTCLSPTQPGYGQVVASAPGRRRAPRKSSLPNVSTTTNSAWSVVTPHTNDGQLEPRSNALPASSYTSYPPQYVPFNAHPESYQQEILPTPDRHSLSLPPPAQRDRPYSRYAPYPDHSPSPTSKASTTEKIPLGLQIPSTTVSAKHESHDINLPPISPAASNRQGSSAAYALPPISALEDLRGVNVNDSAAVLRRLSQNDESDFWPSRATTSAKSSSSWPSAHSTFLPPLAHRLSDPAIKYSGISSSSRPRLSVSSSSDESTFSSHPSPISPPSPSTPLTPQSLPSGNVFIAHLPVLREDQIGCGESFSAKPRSRPVDQEDHSDCRHDADRNHARQPYRPW